MPRIVSPARALVLPVGMRGTASLSFDGVDDRVVGTHGLSLGAPALTAEGWVLVRRIQAAGQDVCSLGPPTTGNVTIYTIGGRWSIGIYGVVDMTSAVPVAIGRWMHFAGSHPGGTGRFRIHLNGALIHTDTVDRTFDITGTAASLGAATTGARPNFGFQSNWRIYASRLTDAQLAARARGEEIAIAPVRWWKLEDGSGTTTREEIGGTNDTIIGAVWSTGDNREVPFRPRVVASARAAAGWRLAA